MSLKKQSDVLVIGAGIAGLMCATRLRENGADVQLIDKGRNYGGRMSTRSFDGAIFDHGAQFFTVRESSFQHYVDQWAAAGVIDIWFETMPGRESQHPRWYAPNGMNSLPRHVAQPLAVDLSTTAIQITRTQQEWIVRCEKDSEYRAKHLVLTTPSPQTVALFESCNETLPSHIHESLQKVAYDKGLAILLKLSTPSPLPAPGCMQLQEHPSIAWIADNQIKGISPLPALTVHTTAAFATEMWEEANENKIALVVDELTPLMPISIESAQAHRWGYTMPVNPMSEGAFTCPTLNVTLSGDALGGPKVEGSACSGLTAAEQIVALA